MDILKFVASFEWPVVVAGTLWVLRKQVQDMLGRINLTGFEGFGVKATFEKALDKVDALLLPPSPPAPAAPPVFYTPGTETRYSTISGPGVFAGITPPDEPQFGGYAAPLEYQSEAQLSPPVLPPIEPVKYTGSPETIILSAWRRLDSVIRQKDRLRGLGVTKDAHLLNLTADELAALEELRNLRNQIAHNVNVSVAREEALRYANTADRLLARVTYGPDLTTPP